MTAQELLYALNDVNDDLIQQAGMAGGHFSDRERTAATWKGRGIWLVAAAFALAVLSCTSWLLLGRNTKPVGSTPLPGGDSHLSANSSVPSQTDFEGLAPTETEFVWPEDEFPYPDAVTLESLELAGLTLEDYLDMLRNPEKYHMALGEIPSQFDAENFHADPALVKALLDLHVGKLWLGQPQAEVLEYYGEPTERMDADHVEKVQGDGTRRDNWLYRFGAEQSLRITFVDAGDGFVVNEIDVSGAELDGDRPLGIYVGQSFEAAAAAFRANSTLSPVTERNDYTYEDAGTCESLISARISDVETGTPGWLQFSVYYFDYHIESEHCVQCIHLGSLYPDPPTEEEIDPEQEEINRRFDSNEITVWLPEADGWQGQTWQEEEAKLIWAQFSVELPEPWNYDGAAPIAVLDFHNGYAAALFDEEEHGAVYRVTDRAAFEEGLVEGDPLRGLELWEYLRYSKNTLLYSRDPYTFAADWDLAFFVGARYDHLLPAVREKDVEIFTATGMELTLFREKGHYVIAGVFDGGEKITAYGRFFADHTLYDNTRDFPMIDLPEPAELLGMDLAAVKAACGEPVWEEKRGGETCPCWISNTGYIVILHLDGDMVTAIELYDHEPTPTTLSASSDLIPYQYGDTTPTWRPELAENYPADEDCGEALLLEKWMAVEGLTMADLDARDCRQLILVAAQPSGGAGTVTVCYERSVGGGFVPAEGLGRMYGFVGENGIRHDRRRNTDTSPAGLWALSFAFGNESPPEDLKLLWRQVTPNSDWVCDEASPYFNTWQERGDPELLPWGDDVEHLEDYPAQYAWACVIEFNRPPDVVPDRGCAIFLHCAQRATGGCVGLPRTDMLSILEWLDPEEKPYILISGVCAES